MINLVLKVHLCKAAKNQALLTIVMMTNQRLHQKMQRSPSFCVILLPRRATWHALHSLQYS